MKKPRNRWKRCEKRRVVNDVAGVYRTVTSDGRSIYCYSTDVHSAIRNSLTGMKPHEYVKSIGRE